MNDPVFEQLVENAQRRKLTPQEYSELENCFVRSPELRDVWELEARLNQTLAQLPDAPLSPGFAARVLDTVESLDRRQSKQQGWSLGEWLRLPIVRWLSPVAVAGVALVSTWIVFDRQKNRELGALALQASRFASLAMLHPESAQNRTAIPQVPFEWLKDYDMITLIPVSTEIRADVDLLASLQ